MNWDAPRPRRRARMLSGLMLATALGLGMAAHVSAPVSAAGISAKFQRSSGKLTVDGDAAHNTITVSRDPAGTILVNGGAVPISGGTPTVANTVLIEVNGRAGDDRLSLDEANGPLPAGHLDGGAGADILTGGAGADTLDGGPGNDTLLGKGGNDLLIGGAGDDTLTGGDGDDTAKGGDGNDRLIWNPGDDSDVNEGGSGIDTVEVNGGNGAEAFTIAANGKRVRFDRTTPAPFSIDIGTAEKLIVNGNGGDDVVDASGLRAGVIGLTLDGGDGNDVLIGSDGNDTLLGQAGDDVLIGGPGADTLDGGPGNNIVIQD